MPADAVSVALNVTATQADDNGFLTVFPNGQPLPVASNVNYTTGADVPNLVVAKLGTDGSINIFSEDATHVIVDIFGWFGTNADQRLRAGRAPESGIRQPTGRRQGGGRPGRHVPGRRHWAAFLLARHRSR